MLKPQEVLGNLYIKIRLNHILIYVSVFFIISLNVAGWVIKIFNLNIAKWLPRELLPYPWNVVVLFSFYGVFIIWFLGSAFGGRLIKYSTICQPVEYDSSSMSPNFEHKIPIAALIVIVNKICSKQAMTKPLLYLVHHKTIDAFLADVYKKQQSLVVTTGLVEAITQYQSEIHSIVKHCLCQEDSDDDE